MVTYLFGNEVIYSLVAAGGMMLLAAVAMLYVNDGKLIRVPR
jgi:maltose/moltooligosaccharide transporter